MNPFNERTWRIMSLALEENEGSDEESAEDGEYSEETVMRQMGFGHLITHSCSNQESSVSAHSNSAILGQDASCLISLDNLDFSDTPVIEVNAHGNTERNALEISTKNDTCSIKEVEKIVSGDVFVVECRSNGDTRYVSGVDYVQPSKSTDLQTAEGSISLSKIEVLLPEVQHESVVEANERKEIESNIDDPSFVFDPNSIHSSDSEAADEPESDMPSCNVEDIPSAPLCQSTEFLPERPAAIKRKKVEEWERNKLKRLRLEGKQYTSLERKKDSGIVKKSKKDRKAREIRPACNSAACLKSSKRHCMQIPVTVRNSMFQRFWSMTWDERRTYVASLVKSTSKKQVRRKESGDRRTMSLHYHLIVDGSQKEVCKKTFLNTFAIGEWAVRNWVMNSEHGMSGRPNTTVKEATTESNPNEVIGQPSTERTNDKNTRNLTSPKAAITKGKTENKLFAVDFLNKLPKMESHYCRKDTSKLYLEPIINSGQQLYKLYTDSCRSEDKIPVCRFTFMEVVTSMNISLFQTKKDQCNVCCEHKVGNISEEKYKDHIKAKTEARDEKETDKARACRGECNVYTVDLQQVKLAPALQASALYYKTKLCCHNHTFFNLQTKEVCCYWWNESEGEIKATNFTSCVVDFLEAEIAAWPEEKPKHIILWSDGCVYQNKNKTLANALLHQATKTKFLIEQKYLEKGHTQMEADSVHACIERRLKNREIHHPHDYLTVTREARMKPFPYVEKCISHSFFKNFDIPTGEAYSSIRPGNFKNDPTVNDVVQLTYTSEGISYKLQFTSPLQKLPQRRKTTPENIEYTRLYNSRLKLTHIKWQHLQELKQVLPQHVHKFYDNLPHYDKIEKTTSGTSGRK